MPRIDRWTIPRFANAVAWFQIAWRVLFILLIPIGCDVLLNVLLSSPQGSEIQRLATTDKKEWLSVMGVASLVLSVSLALSTFVILMAYRSRLEIRLRFTSNGSGKAKKITAALTLIFLLLPIPTIWNMFTNEHLSAFWSTSAVTAFLLSLFLLKESHLNLINQSAASFVALIFSVGIILVGLSLSVINWTPISEYIISGGPLAIALFSLSFWCVCFSILLVAAPISYGFGTLILLPLLLSMYWSSRYDYNDITDVPDQSKILDRIVKDCQMRGSRAYEVRQRIQLKRECRVLMSLGERFETWLMSRKIDDKNVDVIPVFLISAEGGGIRAAYWASQVLALLNENTEGKFLEQTFAFSGVSGGAVGLLTVADTLRVNPRNRSYDAKNALRRTFRQDLLSPLLEGLLFADAMRNLIGPYVFAPTRATRFEASLSDIWARNFGESSFKSPFIKSFGDDTASTVPLLLINATEVDSGNRFILSNAGLDPLDYQPSYVAFDPGAAFEVEGLTTAQVAHLSARFLYLSPPATIRARGSDMAQRIESQLHPTTFEPRTPIWGRIVDGGYFENSGSETLLDTIHALEHVADAVFSHVAEQKGLVSTEEFAFAARLRKLRFHVVSLQNDPVAYSTDVSRYPNERPPSSLLQELDENRFVRQQDPNAHRLHSTIRYFDLFSEPFAPLEAMINTRSSRGALARNTLKFAVNGTAVPYDLCLNADPNQDFMTRWFRCGEFSGRWTEFNLAQLIYANNANDGDHERKRCGYEAAARPALGWVLDSPAADLMDCLLHAKEGPVADRFAKIKSVLENTRRTDSNVVDFGLVEGWDELRREKVLEGRSIVKEHLGPGLLSSDDRLMASTLAIGKSSLAFAPPARRLTPMPSVLLPQKPCVEVNGIHDLNIELGFAAANNDKVQAICLIARGAEPNFVNSYGFTSLRIAYIYHHYDMGDVLLKHGAHIDVPDQFGMTLLMMATANGDLKLVRELLRHGAGVNIQSASGTSALMDAASVCRIDLVRELLAHSANVDLQDKESRTAHDLAVRSPLGFSCPIVAKAIEGVRSPHSGVSRK